MKYVPIKNFVNIAKQPIMVQVTVDCPPEQLTTKNVLKVVLQTANYTNSTDILKANDILHKTCDEVDGYLAIEDADFEFILGLLMVSELFIGMKINAVDIYQTFKLAISTTPEHAVSPGQEEELDN